MHWKTYAQQENLRIGYRSYYKMNIKEIVTEYLEKNGYDGLDSGCCWCGLEDIMQCDNNIANCEAGYKVPFTGLGPNWCISTKKPTTQDTK